MPAKAAYVHLIGDHGLTTKAASDVLSRANRRENKFRIKYAAPYDMINSAPVGPSVGIPSEGQDSMFNSGLPSTSGQPEEYPVDMGQSNPQEQDMAAPVDPQTMQSVMQAAESGQKEVLDASLLSNMLNATQDDTLVDQYLPDVVKGMDRKGRLLLNMYWHDEKFRDRFGEDKMPQLEDALRNSFLSDGDVALELKKRAIEPYPDESAQIDVMGDAAEV
jgi:hypothetical protein